MRLALGLALAAITILIAAGGWNLHRQRAQVTALVEALAVQRAEDIRRSIREAMMRNRPDEVQRIITTLGEQPTIARIRLLDKQGTIRSSTDETETGTIIGREAEQCSPCHAADTPAPALEPAARTRIQTGPGGGRLMNVVTAIGNEPSCVNASCHAHPATQSVLGVLDLQLSLAATDGWLAASERRTLAALFGAVIALLASSWLLTWRLVLRPVRRLTAAAREVTAGDLSTYIQPRSADEIGEMTEAWNTMIAKLGRAQIVLERWGRTLEQKVEEKTGELEAAHREMLRVEKMASLGKLSAVVAHEINNPLTGIGTYARLLRKRHAQAGGDEAAAADTLRILDLIAEEADRCGEIVRSLLLFGRTPAATFASARLGPLLERSLLLLRPQAESRQVDLRLAVEPDLPPIECDASQVQQMIMALGLNAIEAADRGGQVDLEARQAAATEQVVIEVRDNGHGIAREDVERLFEPFFSTKKEGRGVGLGLAVAYGIARRHHGSIVVDSQPGDGATFTVRLPHRQPPAAREATS